MMDHKSFDEHVRDQFSGYSPEVPSHIWDNIMARKDRRKPAGLFFLNAKGIAILLIGLVIGAGTIYYYNQIPGESHITAGTANKSGNNNIEGNIGVENSSSAATQQLPAGSGSNQQGQSSTQNITPLEYNKSNLVTTIQPESESFQSTDNLKRTAIGSSQVKTTNAIPEEVEDLDDKLNPFYEPLSPYLSSIGSLLMKKPAFPSLPIPCPSAEDNAAGNKRYFEIYGSADKAFRSFSDTGNSTYLQARKQTTSTQLSFSAGFRYTRVFNNGMSIRAGVNYSQINEKFTYSNGHVVQMVYILNSNGDTTGSYIQSGTRYKSSMNKYRTLDIPLMVGYELGNGRLHANINAGPVINIYSWQKGSLLDTSGNIIDISTGKGETPYHFRKNMGIGFMGAVSAYYKLNDRYHILAEPYFRYNFSPANKPEMTFKQKYNTAGLRLGIRMDF